MSVTIIDGGMGKELARIGAPFTQPLWSAQALLEAPDQVSVAHENYIEAGAEVITVNSYSCVPYHLGDSFEELGRDLIQLAAELARESADEAGRPVLVAGSIPPPFGSYLPDAFDADEAPDIFRLMIETQAPYVDLWIAETISSLDEFDAVVDAVDDDDMELWAAFCVDDQLHDGEAKLRSGETVAEIVEHAAADCDALLLNCSIPEATDVAMAVLAAELDGTLPFGAYANAMPAIDDTHRANETLRDPRADLTPAVYADIVSGWIDLGATIVGGCCGVSPEHIHELVKRFG